MTIKKAVAVIIEDEDGRVLLTQRGRIARDELGKWENCGGAVDEGETEEAAVKREVKEELGCELTVEKVWYRDSFVTDSGATWEVTIFGGKIRGEARVQNQEENEAVGWFEKPKLSTVNLASYSRKDFERLGWIK
jgi:8-oxo-dGTP diphosphatase